MIPMTSIGLAAIIIHDATIRPSAKKERASRIFLLLSVDKYRYVTKKFAELTMDAFRTIKTPMSPISVLPTAVNRVRAEKGVTIAHPGKRSFALRSIDHRTPSSPKYRRYRVFWCLAARSLQRQASLENLSWRQFAKIRCCVE